MSASAQALYFHLGMHGDDDGFVSSPRKIARIAGCNDDDLRLLAAKGYIIPFESGVVVITDWNINNTLKNDRYKDVTIISSGVMLTQCLEAAEVLANQGVQARVINMHTIKPIDADTVVRAAKETGAIITVENHSVIGGLGSAVAEVLAEQCPCKMHRLGIQDRFGEVGDRAYLRKCMGIDTTDIVDAALNIKK